MSRGPVSDIAARFKGTLYEKGEPGYEAARVARIWHALRPDRFPDAVLEAECENDIFEGVRLAKGRGWRVAVRAGGHSFAVWSVREGGLLIDLGKFKDIGFDPETGIATATPSVQGGYELNAFLRQHGRYFAGGGCPTVGIGGFLLQGGIGWNFRCWGYAAEQIVAIDLVTADGERVRANESENADLFWAARGGGPGFCGVITRFHLRTRAIPAGMALTLQVYPIELYSQVLDWVWNQQEQFSNELMLACASFQSHMLVKDHPGSACFVVWAVAYCDTMEQSAEMLRPLQDCPLLDKAITVIDTAPTTLEAQYAMVEDAHPEGLHYRVDSAWIEGPKEEAATALATLMAGRIEGDQGYTVLSFALPRPQAPDMAADLRSDILVTTYTIRDDTASEGAIIAWLGRAMAELEPYTVGQYWGDSDQQLREVKCLSNKSWDRLQSILDNRDPDQRFHRHLGPADSYMNRNGWQKVNRGFAVCE